MTVSNNYFVCTLSNVHMLHFFSNYFQKAEEVSPGANSMGQGIMKKRKRHLLKIRTLAYMRIVLKIMKNKLAKKYTVLHSM